MIVYLPRFLYDLLEDSDGVVVGHVLEADVVHLEDHVARFYPAVKSYSAT